MIDLRNYRNWDKANGTLSTPLNPKEDGADNCMYVVLNGSKGNFCLDYSNQDIEPNTTREMAWSSDTGYYVKILQNDVVRVTRWWDNYKDEIRYELIQQKPQKFYEALVKNSYWQTDDVVSFAKSAFIKLRNCIPQSINGEISLRLYMYLLAALEEGVDTAQQINNDKWKLKPFVDDVISNHDWEWLYQSFKKGINNNKPNIKLLLRHASNKLFQEAHREATRKDFQLALFEGANRKYNEGITDGAFYTPTPLVRTIVQESLWALNNVKELSQRESITILDPACGSSEFLRETLRQLKIREYQGSISVTGWDISHIACEMSNFVLNYESNTEWNSSININIKQGDSLTEDWVGTYDIVLMNPPFLAFEHLKERKSIVLEKLENLSTRQPDLAAVFLKKAAEVTSENGVLGLVLPHSLIGGETYKKLRTHIVEELGFDFSLTARLGSAGLFEKAMIIPSVLVGVKQSKSKANTILWTDHQQNSVYTALRELRIYRSNEIPTPINKDEYSIYETENNQSEKDNWNVKSYRNYLLLNSLRQFTKVQDLFNIAQGVISGNNTAFLLTKEEVSSLPLNEQLFFRPCIMRDSINDGQLNDKLYLFFPYGDYKISNEDELKEKLNSYYTTRLLKFKNKLKSRKNFENKWWELNRPRSFHDTPKLVSAYFGKAGYFAFDKTGDYLVGQSFAWLPKTKKLDKDTYKYAYLALLHAPIINTLFETVCNVLEGGYYDFSKHYIDNMPMPDLSKSEDKDTIQYLIEVGKKIQTGKEIDFSSLNQAVANAYGINLEYFQ